MLSLTEIPGIVLSSTNADIPLGPLDLSVNANTTNVSAKPEFVVNILEPFMI